MRNGKVKSRSAARKVADVNNNFNESSVLSRKGNGSIPVLSDGTVSSNNAFDRYEESIMEEHNNLVGEQINKWDEKQRELDESIAQVMNSVENIDIRPFGRYVLVKPFSANPFSRMKTLENGFIVPEFDPSYKDDGTGEIREMLKIVEFAKVVEVPVGNENDNIFVERGDIVFYQSPEAIPLPYYNQGFKLVALQSIKAIINDRKRFERSKKK